MMIPTWHHGYACSGEPFVTEAYQNEAYMERRPVPWAEPWQLSVGEAKYSLSATLLDKALNVHGPAP